MEWSYAINVDERGVRQHAAGTLGFSILIRNLDVEAISLPIFNRTITIETPEQAALVAHSIAAGRNGIYYDPQNLLGSATINRIVVLG